MFNWWKTREDKPLFSQDPKEIARTYNRKRRMVLVTITMGTAMYYICRLSHSVAKKPMIDSGMVNAYQLGVMGSAFFFVYAFSKLINGFLSDHSNIQRFIPTGLLISALLTIIVGSASWAIAFIILWGINGWFQGMNSAPTGSTIAKWYSNRERGTKYSIWSAGHSIGEGLSFIATAALISYLGWRWGFWGPGIVCIIAAFIFFQTYQDRPQTYGLPAIADFKNDHGMATRDDNATLLKRQLGVLKNPWVWVLGCSSALMYVARYAMNNWGIFYLQEGKGYSLVQAGSVLAFYPIAAVGGAVTCGWISDKFFGARRGPVTLAYGLTEIITLIIFYLIPAGNVWLDRLIMTLFGFAMGGLLALLGGLIAIDISPKRAAGAAMGIIGGFSYIGASIQDYVSGYLIESSKAVIHGVTTYNFDNAFYFWIGASILSLILATTLWNVKVKD